MHKFLRSLINKFGLTLVGPRYDFVGKRNNNYCFWANNISPNSLKITKSISEINLVKKYKMEIITLLRADLPIRIFPCLNNVQ